MTRPVSLLVVDDDAVFLDILRRWFTRQAYNVTALPDPIAAVAVLHKDVIDVALVDLGFSCGGGMEFVEQLNRNSAKPHVIVLSGRTDSESIAEARGRGASDYLVKPCTLAQIQTAVESAVAARIQGPAISMAEASQ